MFTEYETALPSIKDVVSGNISIFSFSTIDCKIWFLNTLTHYIAKTYKENNDEWKNEFHNIFTFIENNYTIDWLNYSLRIISEKYNIDLTKEHDVNKLHAKINDFILNTL